MGLVYLQIECEHSFSRMLASQQSDKTAEKFEGIVSGDTSCVMPISNLQIENLDRIIKFLGLSKQKSPFFLDYLVALWGTHLHLPQMHMMTMMKA
jgi:hypothetical protein